MYCLHPALISFRSARCFLLRSLPCWPVHRQFLFLVGSEEGFFVWSAFVGSIEAPCFGLQYGSWDFLHSSDWLELICVSKFTTQLFCEHFSAASYPDVSLSMKMCAQRKAGRSQRTRRHFACRLYPFHGPLRSVTSRSSTLRKTKRPRRRLIAQYVYNKKQIKEEARVKVENYLKVVGSV